MENTNTRYQAYQVSIGNARDFEAERKLDQVLAANFTVEEKTEVASSAKEFYATRSAYIKAVVAAVEGIQDADNWDIDWSVKEVFDSVRVMNCNDCEHFRVDFNTAIDEVVAAAKAIA